MANKLLLINVLDQDSYNDCHIPESINIPFNKLQEATREMEKDTEIIVYCASYECSASREAWHILDQAGFTNIWAYEGGVREWKQSGKPTQGACSAPYLIPKSGKPGVTDSSIKTITLEQLEHKLKIRKS